MKAMHDGKRWFLGCAVTGTSLVLIAAPPQGAWSQMSGTIRIVVPNPPGAGTDILARLLAEQIGRAGGPTMIVENRPGAGNVIGSQVVAHAAPDGRTLLINANPFVIDPYLRKLNYNPLTSFEPVCYLANSPLVYLVNKNSPYRTLEDLIGAAHVAPRALTMATVGPGTAGHIGFEMLKRAADLEMTFVPYPGNPPAITALLSGQVTAVFTAYPVVAELVKAGQLRALAVATQTRIGSLPDVPTVAESGYTGYHVDFWIGVVAPGKTPKKVVSELAGLFAAALRAPEVRTKLSAQELHSIGLCGDEFATFIRKQYKAYGRIISDVNIKTD